MQAYTTIQNDILQQPTVREIQFVRLHLGPLSRSLQESARQWVVSLGKSMNESAHQNMKQLTEELEVSVCVCACVCVCVCVCARDGSSTLVLVIYYKVNCIQFIMTVNNALHNNWLIRVVVRMWSL